MGLSTRICHIMPSVRPIVQLWNINAVYFTSTRSARGQNQWVCSERQQLSVPSGGRADSARRFPDRIYIPQTVGYDEGMGHKSHCHYLGPCRQQPAIAGRGPNRNQ